jgi:hypothetical protein
MLVAATFAAGTAIAQTPSSWNDAAPAQGLLGFVARVTRETSRACAKPAGRIAVFDAEGAPWDEQLLCFQCAFAPDLIRTLAAIHPGSRTKQPLRAAIQGDGGAPAKSGERGLQEIPAASHAGITTDKRVTVDS